MDDLSEKIGEILNDEESMRQIRELADMLTGSASSENNGGTESFDPSPSDGGAPDLSAIMNMLGGLNGGNNGNNGNGGAPPAFDFDMGTAMRIMSVIQGAGANDKNSDLLIALRPLLSEDKQARVDNALKFLRLYAVYNSLKDSGFKLF